MKSLMSFLQYTLDDLGVWCRVSTSRDYQTITARVEHEGISFLTISLPTYGKDFERSLDQGYVGPDQFPAFARTGGLPRLFGGFLDQVFNRSTGRLLDDPSVDSIRAIRQITLMFGKIELPCTSAREFAAIKKYVECEKDVIESTRTLDPLLRERYLRVGRLLWADFFTEIDRKIYYGEIKPKHGPGATADKLKGNRKYNQQVWTERLEAYFPMGRMLTYSWTSFLSDLSHVNLLEPGAEMPVKVITVPKTLKTPRIIAVEPTCMQYAQQAVLEAIVDTIEDFDIPRSFIRFLDQTPNQELAKEGSLTGHLATLDLSEASDRVSNQHVEDLMLNHPHFRGAVQACRSTKADVPGHGIIPLSKFASMGSALCFPMEAIVFLTVIFTGIEQALNRPITMKDIKSLRGSVRVYGDDIIVPVEYTSAVVECLEAFGLKVNSSKSFWNGKFRESCGKEYYNGHDVTLARVRNNFPTQLQHTSELVSTVSLRNQLFERGFEKSVEFLDRLIERFIPFPVVEKTASALGKHSHSAYKAERMCPSLQRPLVKAAVVIPKLPVSQLDGYGALMKMFLKRGDLPFADRNHLLYAGRPVSVDIKTRWTTPY